MQREIRFGKESQRAVAFCPYNWTKKDKNAGPKIIVCFLKKLFKSQCQQRATPRPSPTTFWLLCFFFGKYRISEKETKLSPSSNIHESQTSFSRPKTGWQTPRKFQCNLEPFPQDVLFWAVAQMLGQICTDRRHQKLWPRHQHTQHQRIGGIGKAGDLSEPLETKKKTSPDNWHLKMVVSLNRNLL